MSQVSDFVGECGPAVVPLGRGARRGCAVVVAPGRLAALTRSLLRDRVAVRIGGEESESRALARDRSAGLTVLEADTATVAPIRWADEPPDLGARVLALGDPGTGMRATRGRVSAAPLTVRARGGRPLEMIEHTAPLPRGTGGGPLLDADGRVLGLNVLRGDPGFLLALSSSVAAPAVRRMLDGVPEAGRLGVAVASARASRRMRAAVGLDGRDGLLVREVESGSAAERAGVLAGDLLVRLGDTELAGVDDLFSALAAANGDHGNVVVLAVVRGERELELPVDVEAAAAR